jgi:hypothetical protein
VIEAFASSHHHLAGVGLLDFPMGLSFGFSELFSGEIRLLFVLFRRGFLVFVLNFLFCL